MTRLRVTGRGVAYVASALIHAGVVAVLLPSLTGSAEPTPAETPMAIEMAGFGGPAEALDTAEPVETAQPEQIDPAEAVPTETAQTQPVETAQPEPVETVVEEPPPPAETPVTEAAEVEPPEPAPEAPPPELVTTTGETEAVVAAVPDTIQAVEPEAVQAAEPEVVPPPPTKPKPRAERRPRREQPRRTEQPAAAPTETASLPPQASPPPTAASAPSAQAKADYRSQLSAYLRPRIRSVNSLVREQTLATVTVTIESDGTLSAVELTRSSGSDSVDRELLRKVRAASPVPAPPARIANYAFPFDLRPR
ncbi:energy transducer TonB [Inquilinus sp. OTU3971]|uniref:energy transducer TonB n=1 Tax=Inquilinus sp. OTU3971 TaxID=3043855 RepID=UPI00313ED281